MKISSLSTKKYSLLIIFIVIIFSFIIIWWFLNLKYQSNNSSLHPPNQNGNQEETKTYRNTEFGFEFQYPEGWTFHENTFYSSASKFNLVGASPEERGVPNPIIPALLINIVTSSFADNVIASIKHLGATELNITVGGVNGVKYEYKVGVQEEVLVDISFEEYRLELSAIRGYEDTFNGVISTFKFLK